MKKKIITITYNDPGISYGPAVHFLELWNNYHKLYKNCIAIKGFAPSWTYKNPILNPVFDLKLIKVPNISLLRQLIYDLYVCFIIMKYRKELLYIRCSNSFFSLFFLRIFTPKYIVELNGIAYDDCISAKRSKLMRNLLVFIEKQLIKHSLAAISVSDGISNHAKSIKKNNCITIVNGVADNLFDLTLKKSVPKKTIIYVGTFTSWDGHEEIVKLANSFPEYNFLMVGDGPNRMILQEKAPSNMTFTGYVNYADLEKYYVQADAGIVLYEKQRHNHVEISPLKILEYIASALPIFTTNVPGLSFIEKNQLGVLAKGEEYKKPFSEFMKNLDYYSGKMEKFRKEQRSELSWSRVAQKTHEVSFNC